MIGLEAMHFGQAPLKLQAAYARHLNIHHETVRFVHVAGVQKRFSIFKYRDVIPGRSDQAAGRIAHTFVIVHNADNGDCCLASYSLPNSGSDAVVEANLRLSGGLR